MRLVAVLDIDGEFVPPEPRTNVGVFYQAVAVYRKMVAVHRKAEPAGDVELTGKRPEDKCSADILNAAVGILEAGVHQLRDTLC